MNEHVVRRPSLPLTAQDEVDLETIRTAPEFRAAVAVDLLLDPSDVTDSVLLHFIFTKGLQSIRESVEAEAYEGLAAERRASAAERRADARRRRPSWADEE